MKISLFEKSGTNWKSIYIATILAFIGVLQYSLFFSALWPYLKTIDNTASEKSYGNIIAIYSVGQMIAAPLLGYLSNQIKQVKMPLLIGLFLMLIGNAIYLLMTFLPFPPKYILLIGRFLIGAGSCNTSLLRTYVSTATTFEDRSKAIGYLSCGQALGAILGPVFQLIFSPLHYPGFGLTEHLRFNLYTAPAYFAIFANILGAIIIFCCFEEKYAGIIESPSEEILTEKNSATTTNNYEKNIPNFDFIAVIICLLTRFTQLFVHANLETIGSAFSMSMFNLTKTIAVQYMSAAQIGVGIFGLATYIAYMFFNLEKHLNSRNTIIISVNAFMLFYLLTYSWPFISGNVILWNANPKNLSGCDSDKFSWCESLNPINIYLYYISYVVVIGFAFPLMNVALMTIYSKILGPRRQGVMQGIFQVSGGIARLLGPLLIATAYTDYGPKMTWNLEISVLGITLAAWLVKRKEMNQKLF